MSSQSELSVQDDNILSRRQTIKDSLNVIRDKKERLRTAMRTISQQEQPDREMMSDLLTAFDQMSTQEDQYLQLLKSIVDIHEQATKEVTEEVEKLREEENNQPKEESVETKEQPNQDETNKASAEEMSEIEETLKEIEKVAKQAVQASILNEKLVESLQLHRNKRATLNEIRKEKTADLLEQADAVVAEMEMTKNRVLAARNESACRKKELAELQKKALEKGIQLGVLEDKEKEDAISALEKLTDPTTRVPPIPISNEEVQLPATESVSDERERIASLNAAISEKLKAMEARQLRMKELREMLQAGDMNKEEGKQEDTSTTTTMEGSANSENDKIELDLTIKDAKYNLQSLTNLKERLVEMRNNGEELTDEDAALIDRLDSNKESIEPASNA